ncbi:MAG: DUF4349 domain-containing protein [Bacteroidales bacterium]|jgi:hypothetical protein
MKKKILTPFIMLVFLLGSIQLSGCGASDKKSENSYKKGTSQVSSAGNDASNEQLVPPPPPPNEAEKVNKYKVTPTGKEEEIKTVNKAADEKIPSKIIKTAENSMQVKDIKEGRKAILAIVQQSNAYIASENQTTNSYSMTNDITIRIKPEGFESMVSKLLDISVYTDYNRVTSQDVTADCVDTEARLKSKKEVEERYTEILKKANTIGDILEVEEKLRQIREEIEASEGKLKYMNDQVDYSTINLHFYEKLDYQPAPESGFFYKLGKAFNGGWHGLQVFFIGIIYLWPLWLIAAVIVYCILKLVERGKRKKKPLQK